MNEGREREGGRSRDRKDRGKGRMEVGNQVCELFSPNVQPRYAANSWLGWNGQLHTYTGGQGRQCAALWGPRL